MATVAETLKLAEACLQAQNFAEAERLYRLALAVYPHCASSQSNLGNILRDSGRFADARTCYLNALSLEPDRADIHCNFALSCLIEGDYATGFAEYEWRFVRETGTKIFNELTWDGSPLNGNPILLHSEQGLGDTLQFVRYVPLVMARGGRVSLRIQPELVPLLSGLPGVDRVFANTGFADGWAFNASLLSLPAIFRTSVETVPNAVPYLSADPGLVQQWCQVLSKIQGFKIGICWSGKSTYEFDRERSFPLSVFAPLADVPGVRLISLQKGDAAKQPETTAFPLIQLPDEIDSAGAFTDTAAIMQSLDLIITCDTAIAHLAGALGRPVWVARSTHPEWRWIAGRDTTPWYPTMRLYRQERPGDWSSVFSRIAADLHRMLVPLV